MIIADLHIHSRYSRATAKSLDPEHLWLSAQLKGIDLLGTGDFTHPAWFAEISEKLTPTGDGAFHLAPELEAGLAERLPPSCRREMRFLLSAEISTIYKRHGKTRKVHSLILMPDLDAVKRLNQRLDKLGNIKSDGRPILGLDTRDLLEVCLEADERVIFIPAHIWTPWFSMFGSKSGFDTVEECFDDLTGHIHAMETGLSSDPPMNWRLSALDRYTLVSNSDAHSPAKLAREANLLDCPPTYQDLDQALKKGGAGGFAGTLEFFPHEGKYHLDGHRKCGVRLDPQKTRELGGVCPVCGGKLTVGVLSRVEDLADRADGYKPAEAPGFESLVPLNEVIGEVLGRGPATKGVAKVVDALLYELGPELFILRRAELGSIEKVAGPVAREAVSRMREGKVMLEGGFDGQFGVVKLFTPEERKEINGQKGFWKLSPDQKKNDPAVKKPAVGKAETPTEQEPCKQKAISLNPEQLSAVEHDDGHLIVRAGPGTGKTSLLISRAVRLMQKGLAPTRLLLITFTNKAAEELKERLQKSAPNAAGVRVATFHALGREILRHALGEEPLILSEEEREAILTGIAGEREIKPKKLIQSVTLAKQEFDDPADSRLAKAFTSYQTELEKRGAMDLDDLVREAVKALEKDSAISSEWGKRFEAILVDEYQDVNQVQVRFLKALCGPDCMVTAIGDPDQAIYGFRGARREMFFGFEMDFPAAHNSNLMVNYRSSPEIIQAAHAVISEDRDASRGLLACAGGPGPPPVLHSAPSARAEAAWIAARVVRLLGGLDSRQVESGSMDDADYNARDIAILVRLHAQKAVVAEALKEAGVPVQEVSKKPLAETDPLDFKAQRVSILTMHAAKGLEFKVVFAAGMEEGLLPYEPPGEEPALEDEERRLIFVAMTRAKERLFLSRAARRSLYGKTYKTKTSRFLKGLPDHMLEKTIASKGPRPARQMGLFKDLG